MPEPNCSPAPKGTGKPGPSSATAAFRVMFEQQFNYVWRSLQRLGVHVQDLEDVTHDVFLAVHRHFSEYDPNRPVRPWLFGFAAGTAANYRRLAKHQWEKPGVSVDQTQAPAADMDARFAIWKALQSLEFDRRVVLIMHDLDGYDVPEIATALNVPLNTVYTRLRLARRDLAEFMGREQRQEGEA